MHKTKMDGAADVSEFWNSLPIRNCSANLYVREELEADWRMSAKSAAKRYWQKVV